MLVKLDISSGLHVVFLSGPLVVFDVKSADIRNETFLSGTSILFN